MAGLMAGQWRVGVPNSDLAAPALTISYPPQALSATLIPSICDIDTPLSATLIFLSASLIGATFAIWHLLSLYLVPDSLFSARFAVLRIDRCQIREGGWVKHVAYPSDALKDAKFAQVLHSTKEGSTSEASGQGVNVGRDDLALCATGEPICKETPLLTHHPPFASVAV